MATRSIRAPVHARAAGAAPHQSAAARPGRASPPALRDTRRHADLTRDSRVGSGRGREPWATADVSPRGAVVRPEGMVPSVREPHNRGHAAGMHPGLLPPADPAARPARAPPAPRGACRPGAVALVV